MPMFTAHTQISRAKYPILLLIEAFVGFCMFGPLNFAKPERGLNIVNIILLACPPAQRYF